MAKQRKTKTRKKAAPKSTTDPGCKFAQSARG